MRDIHSLTASCHLCDTADILQPCFMYVLAYYPKTDAVWVSDYTATDYALRFE